MSSAAKSAVATVPLERSIEVLERRLIELRADIDAILTQLASNKVATPAIELADTPEPHASEAIAEAEPAPAANDHSSDEMNQLACAAHTDAVEPDQPSVVDASPETAVGTELPRTESQTSCDLTVIESIDADPAGRLNGFDMELNPTASPVAETAAPQAETQVESTSEAAVTALAPSASPEPAAAIAPESAADSVPASTTASPDVAAEAPVISLQSRQRKQKAGFSTGTSAPIRPGRRLATKIAASIVALLAAATMLAIADKSALGSAQSLPWMSPLPSYVPSGASWPFLGSREAAGEVSTAADNGTSPASAATEDALLSRYREAWPTSW